jgi:hypothetical protein
MAMMLPEVCTSTRDENNLIDNHEPFSQNDDLFSTHHPISKTFLLPSQKMNGLFERWYWEKVYLLTII